MSWTKVIKPGAAYFGVVFAAGFILGTFRVLWLVPRVGVRIAELAEMPLMIVAAAFASRWVVRRFRVPPGMLSRLAVGGTALALLLFAEFEVAARLQGMSPLEALRNRDPVSGTAYFISLGIFAVMPALIPRRFQTKF